MKTRSRRSVLFVAATMAAVLGLASTALACVTFRGRMAVVGTLGSTTVEGDGFAHAYCNQNVAAGLPNGRPVTAAAAPATASSPIAVVTAPGVICRDYLDTSTNTTQPNRLPAGVYEIRFNQGAIVPPGTTSTLGQPAYNYGGPGDPYWTMTAGTGCFRASNAGTTTTLGTFNVDADGVGAGQFTLNPNAAFPSGPTDAYNICIGHMFLPDGVTPAPTTGPGGRAGLLAPFQLIGI